MVDQHAMRHARMPYASLKRCGKLVSDNSASDCKYHLSRSMLLSGTFLSLSTRLSACSSFSPHALFCLPPVSLWRLRDIPAFLIVFACLVSSRCATRGLATGATLHTLSVNAREETPREMAVGVMVKMKAGIGARTSRMKHPTSPVE